MDRLNRPMGDKSSSVDGIKTVKLLLYPQIGSLAAEGSGSQGLKQRAIPKGSGRRDKM